MNKKPLALIGFLFAIVTTALGFVLAYQYIHDRGIKYPSGLYSDFDNINYYTLNPATIRLNITGEKIDAFKKLSVESDIVDEGSLGSFFWSQQDYLQVAGAFHKFVWGESVDDWQINAMSFGRHCANKPIGFESGDVTYYKQLDRSSYNVHQVYISPETGRIVSGENVFRRPLFGWKGVYPSKIKVTADNALQLSEEMGGREFRSKLNNACSIAIVLRTNPEDNGWLVGYFSTDGTANFTIYINPYTGSYNISK
jgi:hypothetical protein